MKSSIARKLLPNNAGIYWMKKAAGALKKELPPFLEKKVLYRGESFQSAWGIDYENVEAHLRALR